jgi:predicted metal-dependent enzyme (double-stranded beta helix superfamily)
MWGEGVMDPFKNFRQDFSVLLDSKPSEKEILSQGAALLGALVKEDQWLPAAFTVDDPARYRQYLLHLDPHRRFSVVSFVWGPGQQTPVHNHTVWGLIGMLRGAEIEQHYLRLPDGTLLPDGEPHRLEPGQVAVVSPSVGDVHRVANAFGDRTSISIHVYEGDIGSVERSTYGADGTEKRFVSGYSNAESAS